MFTLQAVFFFALVAISSCKNYTFIKLQCHQLAAKPMYSWSLELAVNWCVTLSCVGIREESENKYMLLIPPFTHVIKTGKTTDYLLDLSNGTDLNGAPSFLDSKIIFGMYYYNYNVRNCPYQMTEVNDHCEGTNGGEAWCQSFPAFTNNTFNPKTGICSVGRLQDLIREWQ